MKSVVLSSTVGPNLDMVALDTVATGVDGTSVSNYSWTCPDVTPNAPIYFYRELTIWVRQ